MNVPLLLDIKAHILAEPDAFRMDVWSCGTAHCIGGWALVLNDVKLRRNQYDHECLVVEDGLKTTSGEAARLLDLSIAYQEDEDGDEVASPFTRLCYIENWPGRLGYDYERAQSRIKKAQIAAKRIDRFIATNGAE